MQAEWNVHEIAKMNDEQNLRNLCRRFEQEYVDWHRPATYRGYVVTVEWPAIGELGRYTREGVVIQFTTTKNRTMQVRDAQGTVVAEHALVAGVAAKLYQDAGRMLDTSDHCEPDGAPCHCDLCELSLPRTKGNWEASR